MSGNSTVWVFPVNEKVSDNTIKQEFSGSGKVVRIDRSSRGYCHVTYSNQEEAEHAIKTKDREFFQGRFITVEAAKVNEKDEKSVQDKVDKARTDWQKFCLKHLICQNWNIYQCENAVPGGSCYNGHHFCFYCLAMGNGHQPHRNVSPNCPSRRQGWQELPRFKSARERELAESRPGPANQVESVPASGGDCGSQSMANESEVASRLITKPVNLVWTPNGGYQQMDSRCIAGAGNILQRRIESQQPGINSVDEMRSQQEGGSAAGCNGNSLGGESRLENTQQEPTSSVKSNIPRADNLGTISSIRDTGPNNDQVRFKSMSVEANKWVSVELSCCERGPTDFNVRLTSSKKRLAYIMGVINRKDSLRPLNPLEIKSGKPCLALSGSNNIVYRALVLDSIQQRQEVYFLDYGNMEILTAENLYSIDEEMMQQPALSLRCRFNGWPNISEAQNVLAIERLKHFENRNLKCKVLGGKRSVKDVELRDEGSKDVANDIQLWVNIQKPQVGAEQTATRAKLKEILNIRRLEHNKVVDAKKPRLTSEVKDRPEVNGSGMGSKDPRIFLPERMYKKFSPRSQRNQYSLCAPGKNNSGENRTSFARVNQASKMFMNSFAGNSSGNALLCHKTVQLTIPTNKAGAVFGPDGARLRQMRRESRSSITIGASGDETFIKIIGDVNGIKAARGMIQQGLVENS